MVGRLAARCARCLALALALALALVLAPTPARADPPPTEERLREAKELFRQGNALREAGDYERALDFYRRSRAVVESVPNTLNAALCLERLGRYDEALELYEDLLTRLASELTDADRKSIAPTMDALRKRLGRLDVSANVDGALIVDGRPRGMLPLSAAVPLIPGDHLVRVLKDGYETFEARVSLRAGETHALDAKLKPLSRWGKLRVDDPRVPGAELYVDGGLVGKLPWEGTLTPGPHTYLARIGELGSAPARAIVVQGQTVLVGINAQPLGPEMDFAAEPATADVYIDGVPLGRGNWRGRLPLGNHRLEAREIGYQPGLEIVNVTPDSAGHVIVQLRIDREHPRWAVGRTGHLWFEAAAGPALAATFAPGAASACDEGACTSHSAALGAMVALRGGYELPNGLSVELGAGALALHESLTRRLESRFGRRPDQASVASYTYTDDMFLAGPMATAGIGYRRSVSRLFDVTARLHLGVAFPTARDWIDASVSGGEQTLPAEVQGSGASVVSAAFFVMPEVQGKLRAGRVQIGAGLAAALFVLNGPSYPTGETRVRGGTCSDPPTALPIGCAPGVRHVAGERAYGPFALFVPSLDVRYAF